ncbi:MAG TPA: GNAT family N-acetyltransferase, partial [Candidatus Cloacimonadota bacterium]|nr:GNAT family N-acetyltransferase [Candidatus Cloacimonadota bacterium]
MENNFNLNELIQREIFFPIDFSDCIQKDYGIFFYNEDNPLSWDSNHAVITNLGTDLDHTFREILDFYLMKKIKPRIYASMQPDELSVLAPYFVQYHFQLAYKNMNQYFIWRNQPASFHLEGITFQRCYELTEELMDIIFSDDDGGEWTIKVLQRHLQHPSFHLLVGYADTQPVCMASLKLMDGYSRVDDVITHLTHRGKGYGRALMYYLVDYHNSISDNFLYLYASNPVAIKNYKLCGFEDLDFKFDDW